MKPVWALPAVLILIGLGAVFSLGWTPSVQTDALPAEPADGQRFAGKGLKTNTAKASIDLDKVLSGGPPKDGIPALHYPEFTSIPEASPLITDHGFGIALGEAPAKFYPYNIMVWHEIANDMVDSIPVVVTFCPLCGSAMVFDRRVGGTELQFGVSGLLYQSNLLMYDNATESLWSQVLGEAVVGESTGAKLMLLPSSVLTYAEFKKAHPDGLVLSTATGHARDYGFSPYGEYGTNDDIYFPVDGFGNALPAKALVFAVPLPNGPTVLFPFDQLRDAGDASLDVGESLVVVSVKDGRIIASVDGQEAAGYYAMYFSIAVHTADLAIWPG